MFLYSSKHSGLAKAVSLLIFLSWTKSRTANSAILPDLVLGISLTTMIFAGTCLGDAPALILVLILLIKSSVKSMFWVSLIKRTTLVSPCQICPMTKPSITSSICSTCLYISAVPIRTPPGFNVASDLPKIIKPLFSVFKI